MVVILSECWELQCFPIGRRSTASAVTPPWTNFYSNLTLTSPRSFCTLCKSQALRQAKTFWTLCKRLVLHFVQKIANYPSLSHIIPYNYSSNDVSVVRTHYLCRAQHGIFRAKIQTPMTVTLMIRQSTVNVSMSPFNSSSTITSTTQLGLQW